MAKAKNVSANDVLKQMFPDIKTSDDYAEPDKNKQDDGAKVIADLQTKIAELTGKLDVVSTRATAQPQRQQSQAPVRPVFNDDDAPDPTVDPKGYRKWVAMTIAADINYEKQKYAYENQTAAAAQARGETLWTDFSKAYKDYAGNPKRVEIAARSVLERAVAQGIDKDAYMHDQRDRFMKDVVAEMDELFGKPKGETEEEDDDGDTDFVTGAPGGQNVEPRTREAPPSKYGELGSDLVKWQEATGFHS